MEKALVILSGGQDSTTCLYWAINEGYDVHTISFDYGQRHEERELEAAFTVAKRAGIHHGKTELVVLPSILRSVSPLMDKTADLPIHDGTTLSHGLEKTFVPMRNQLFLTIAANRAYEMGARTLVTGVCQVDSGGYPDCTQEFIDAFEAVSSKGTFTGKDGALDYLMVQTPLMNLSKAGAVRMAMGIPGCYSALAWTHTAYDGHYPPTGTDHASQLRAQGFRNAGVPDPLVLRAHEEGLVNLPTTNNYNRVALAHAYNVLEAEQWLS